MPAPWKKGCDNSRQYIKKQRHYSAEKVYPVKAMVFPVVMYECESWTIKKLSAEELMLLNYGVGEDSWKSLGLQDQTSPSYRKSVLNLLWKDWCWSWSSNTLVTWCEELTHLERPWCWERLKLGGEGDNRGSDCWMASPTQFAWVWVNSWIGGGQRAVTCCSPWGCRVGHDWATELNWTDRLFRKPR